MSDFKPGENPFETEGAEAPLSYKSGESPFAEAAPSQDFAPGVNPFKQAKPTSESMSFDEGLHAAKALIDECLEEWSKDTGPLRAIVEQAFDVNKEGRINTNAILSLRRHNIDDERWQRAMQAISDSLQVQDSKAYVRLYKRDKTGKYVAVPLDMSAL